ncbi:MAG: hypothetical protein ACREMY_09190, partial [bacterium]
MAVALVAGCAEYSRKPSGYDGGGSNVRWTAEVPEPKGPLPVLALQSLAPPVELVSSFAADGAALQPLSEAPFLRDQGVKVPQEILGVVEDNHVKVWIDRRSGDAAMYPTLSKLAPLSSGDVERAVRAATSVLSAGELLGVDDTRVVSAQPLILNGETVAGGRDRTKIERKSAPYLAYVAGRRFVNELPVYGPGSRVVVIAGADGHIEGLSRQWKSAKITDRVEPKRSSNEVRR